MPRYLTSLSSTVFFLLIANTPAALGTPDTITIPEASKPNISDGVNLQIANYSWQATNQILLCESGTAVCDQNTRGYSDNIVLANDANNKAEIFFVSDSNLLIFAEPGNGILKGAQFAIEQGLDKPLSFTFPAKDANGVNRQLTLKLASDTSEVERAGVASDTIDVVAVGGAPAPEITEVPEPGTLLFLGFGLAAWAAWRAQKKIIYAR